MQNEFVWETGQPQLSFLTKYATSYAAMLLFIIIKH